jgi:hypothetical protein
LLPGQKPNPRCLGGFVTRTGNQPAMCWAGYTRTGGPFHSSSTLPQNVAPIMYLSSDRIITWSLPRFCSFSSSFTSRGQICDRTNIRWVSVKLRHILPQNRWLTIATQRLSVWSDIWQWEVKEQLKLYNLRTDHVMIPSELKYLIWAKNVNLKYRVFGGKTCPFPMVRVFRVVTPVATVRVRVEPYLEPARQFRPVANTTTNSRVEFKCSFTSIIESRVMRTLAVWESLSLFWRPGLSMINTASVLCIMKVNVRTFKISWSTYLLNYLH